MVTLEPLYILPLRNSNMLETILGAASDLQGCVEKVWKFKRSEKVCEFLIEYASIVQLVDCIDWGEAIR